MSASPIHAVLWDMDGTLALSEPLHMRSLIAVLARHGIAAGDELHPLMFGRAGRDVHGICRERFGLDVPFDAWSAFRAERYVAEAAQLAPRAGALEVWHAAARAGLRQAVVSNAGRMLLEANLNALGLQRPELVSVSANDVRRGKPDPEPYLRAAYLLEVEPRHAVAVEDSPTGARAALTAGMRVLGWPAEAEHVALFPPGTELIDDHPEALARALGLKPSPTAPLPTC